MERSLYPDGVLVDRVMLTRTELTKAAEILRGRLDWTSRGMYSGGALSVNGADTTKIDIAQLSGFVPNGEFLETDTGYFQQALEDYTAGAINYVGIVYTEINTKNQPHETNPNTVATAAEMAWRVRIYEETVYNALSPTDDNLANDARDRFLIVGKVTANGVGVPLTASNIFSPTVYSNLLYADPVDPITGTNIIGVDANMSTGLGTLDWDSAALTLTWTSFGGGAGAAVPITVDANYTVLDGAGYYLTIQVVVSTLPAANDSGTTTIRNLYYQEIPRQTAEDSLHRNMQGTGVLSPNNPHRLSLTDISGEDLPQIEEHQDIMHCNGIWRGSDSGIFAPTISTVAPNGDTLFIQQPIAGDLFYVNGSKLQNSNPGSFLFTPANFTAGTFGPTVKEGAKLYEIYVDDEEVLTVNLRTDTNPLVAPARTVTGAWIIDIADEHPAGSYDLKCNVAAGPIYTFTWGDGVTDGFPVVIDNTAAPADPEGQVIRLYAPDGVYWVDLYINRSNFGPNVDSKLPAGLGTVTDTITVRAHLVYEEYMKVLHAVYWYNGTRGTVGWDTNFSGATSRHTIDKRQWGTLCADEMADAGLAVTDYTSTDELHYSGILFARDDWGGNFVTEYAGAGLVFPVTGGSYYCRGEKLSVETDLTLAITNNTSTVIYADLDGAFQVLDIGAATTFNNDLDAAMQWIMGSTFDRTVSPDDIYVADDEDYAEKGVPLYYLVTSAGNVTRWVDVSRNVNGPVDPWSVGLRRSDPYDATLATHLAAFDSLEAAFLHARIYQNSAKNLTTFIEINIVGDNYIFAGASVTQPANVKVSGTSASGRVISYRDNIPGCWLLNNGCIVSGVYLRFDASVTASSFFGMADVAIGKVLIEDCNYEGQTGTYFINFNVATSLIDFEITNSVLDVHEGLIYDPTAGLTVVLDFKVDNNYITSSSTSDNVYVVDLQFTTGASDLTVRDNLIHKSSTGNGIRGIYTNTACIGVSIVGNYVSIANPADAADSAVGIQANGLAEVRGNIVRGDGSLVVPGAAPALNCVTGLQSTEDVQTVLMADNTLFYVGRGIVATSVNRKTIVDNRINFYNRGVFASDSMGGAALDSFNCSNNYMVGYRDATFDATYTFDEELKAVEIQLRTVAGTNPVSSLIINNNEVYDLTNLYTASADVYGIHFTTLVPGTSATTPLYNININGNSICGLNPHSSQDAYGIYFKCEMQMPLTGDWADNQLKNLSICSNNISCNSDAAFSAMYGINLDIMDAAGVLPLNMYTGDVSNNVINLLTATATLLSSGITTFGATILNSFKIADNVIAANASAISVGFQFGSVKGNHILSRAVGIAVYGYANVIAENHVLCKTEYDLAVSGYCIYVEQTDPERGNDILNNDTYLRGDHTGLFGVLSFGVVPGCNIYMHDDAASFSISGNVTRQFYDSINGGGAAAHIWLAPEHFNTWSIDNNKIFNAYVTAVPPQISLSAGLIVDTSLTAPTNPRGVVADNIIFGSNATPAPSVFNDWEFFIGPHSGAITANNNRITLPFTGAGPARQAAVSIVPLTIEPVITNIGDSYDGLGAYVGVPF